MVLSSDCSGKFWKRQQRHLTREMDEVPHQQQDTWVASYRGEPFYKTLPITNETTACLEHRSGAWVIYLTTMVIQNRRALTFVKGSGTDCGSFMDLSLHFLDRSRRKKKSPESRAILNAFRKTRRD